MSTVPSPPSEAAQRPKPSRGAVAFVFGAARLALGRLSERTAPVVAGVGGAGLVAVSGVGWPAPRLYAADRGWSPARTRRLVAMALLGIQLVVLAFLGAPEFVGPVLPVALVGMGAGLVVGPAVVRRPSARARWGVLAPAALLGLLLLILGPLG